MRQDKIVIVEDDPAMSEALRRLLSVAGFTVSGFQSAEALLNSEMARDPACLVLDVHLPGISGFELRRRLVDSGSRAKVIFITAQEDEHVRAEAFRSGAEAFFTKPFPGRKLIEALRAALAANQYETIAP
ncbi:MAG TPA: response regulator [Thermoanaerobaculia bacterium]|nr:response regulator [Thermoanaerobaculia bacterium]